MYIVGYGQCESEHVTGVHYDEQCLWSHCSGQFDFPFFFI